MLLRSIFVIIGVFFCLEIHAQTNLLQADFETGIPLNFTLVDNDNNTPDPSVSEYVDAWITLPDPENPEDTVASSTSYFEPMGTANRWLITPSLTLGSYGNFLSWKAKSQDASFPDDYLVLVSTTDLEMASFTDTIGLIQEEESEWTTRQVDLSAAGYDDQTIYVAFVLNTEDGYKLYLNDLLVWKEDPASITDLVTKLSIFPNPVHDKLVVNSNAQVIGLTLISMEGRKVLQCTNHEMNVSTIENGSYYLRVETNTGNYVKNIRIQH
jgi:hypothetical protein